MRATRGRKSRFSGHYFLKQSLQYIQSVNVACCTDALGVGLSIASTQAGNCRSRAPTVALAVAAVAQAAAATAVFVSDHALT